MKNYINFVAFVVPYYKQLLSLTVISAGFLGFWPPGS